MNYVLNTILKLWHPFMPFVTEAIWREVYGEDQMLVVEAWPNVIAREAKQSLEFEIIKNITTGIRSLRAEYKIESAKKVNVTISAGDKEKLLSENAEIIKVLARLENLTIAEKAKRPDGSVGFVESGVEVFIGLSGLVDFDKEKKRLQEEITMTEKYLSGLKGKLSNKEFVKNAPKEIVEKEQAKMSEAEEKIAKLKSQFESII